jgi:hypothetical protein
MVYFWEGCKKTCCRKTIPVNGFLDSFSVLKIEDQLQHNHSNVTELENRTKIQEMFRSSKYLSVNEHKEDKGSNCKIFVNQMKKSFLKVIQSALSAKISISILEALVIFGKNQEET